ncbi:MAG: flagellar hook assembly protein FlgD [candidate division Zixibacteria bacterium]|nr:flagellar hook assembly protein FlgD [candidate division Zixibacteria bacterium]
MIISPLPTDAQGNPRATGSQKELGRDEFLQLFVTKLRYQDPLEPMSDGAFVAQLAQFSSLEQMTNINETLEATLQWSILNNQTINNSVAAELIGNEVVADLSVISLEEGGSAKANYQLDAFATNVTIEIRNESGELVRTLSQEDVESGMNSVIWDGKGDSGESMPDGLYYVSVSATGADGLPVDASERLVGIVEGVIYRSGIAFLKVDGVEIALGDIREINEPPE